MRCELVADASVYRYAVFAEIAWLERRPELGLLCRAALDSGGSITVAVMQKALPGLSEVGAANILMWCQTIGLCDGGGLLTQAGHTAAQDNEVPVPEQGVFDLWVVHHPLTGSRILHCARRAPSNDGRFEDVTDLAVEPEQDRVFVSVLDGKERFMLRSRRRAPGPLKGVLKRSKSRCSVRWNLDFEADRNEWHLEGHLDDVRQYQSSGHEAEIDLPGLFADWARDHLANQGRWDVTQRRFLVTFGHLSPAEQDGFKKSYSVPKVRAGAYGEFEKVIFHDVPIGPKTGEDATKWANARLERKLGEAKQTAIYRSRNDLRRLFVELIDETPLEPASPVLSAHDELLERYRSSAGVYWSLAAGVDLSPVEPTPEELASLTIGQNPPATAPRPNTVRVPYRGGWSMADLVTRILGGTTPRRVLLCDRYVMTPTQRASLELLCATLRGVHPTVTVDVVTQTDGQDKNVLAATSKIIGPNGKLRGYHDVFGSTKRNHPHARYFLVVPSEPTESAFGWQMDNSPLDGTATTGAPATPNTPLRWRDFSAVRLRVDEAPVDLARWFSGASL